MKKLAGGIAFGIGLLTFICAIIAILASYTIFDAQWANDIASKSNVTKGGLWVSAAFAVLQMAIGLWSMKKPTGVSSAILLVIFGIQFAIGIFNGIHSGSWPTTTIIIIAIQGIAAFGLLGAFVKK